MREMGEMGEMGEMREMGEKTNNVACFSLRECGE
jgi:hypothetical protein